MFWAVNHSIGSAYKILQANGYRTFCQPFDFGQTTLLELEVGGKWAYPQKHVITTLFSVKVVEHHIPKKIFEKYQVSKNCRLFLCFFAKISNFCKNYAFSIFKGCFCLFNYTKR